MAKVIVERPRFGSRQPTKGKGYDRRTARIAWEDQPKREGIKVRSGGGKSLNEHFGPLRRYLESQVGQSWNKVFADVCRYLDRGSAVQDHVRDHLDDYVEQRVIRVDGQFCHGEGWWTGWPLRSAYYVCPLNGILKRNRRYRDDWFRRERKQLQIHFLGHGAALVRKDGAWFAITVERFPERVWVRGVGHAPAVHIQHWDALHKTRLYRDQAIRIYGRPIHAATARRASKREVRPVVNSYPLTNIVR